MFYRWTLSRRAHRGVADKLPPLTLVAILLLPVPGLARGIELDSREYKLMLRSGPFAGTEPGPAIEQFKRDQLVPAVRARWNQDAATELAEQKLKVGERRIVRFWDTRECLLHRHGFA
jgi:hypothetical protein